MRTMIRGLAMVHVPECCEFCKFWKIRNGPAWENHPNFGSLGICRRHAPITERENNDTWWPYTLKDDWCGDYEEKYNPFEENS